MSELDNAHSTAHRETGPLPCINAGQGTTKVDQKHHTSRPQLGRGTKVEDDAHVHIQFSISIQPRGIAELNRRRARREKRKRPVSHDAARASYATDHRGILLIGSKRFSFISVSYNN